MADDARPDGMRPLPRGTGRRFRFQESGLLAVVLALGCLLTLLSDDVTVRGRTADNFLRLDNLLPNVLTPMSWMAIMALGATLVIVSGGIDISVGSVFGLSALGAAAALQALPAQAPAVLALPVGAAAACGIGTACGLANGALVAGLRVHPFIVTLGTLGIFRGLALVLVPGKSLPGLDGELPRSLTRDLVGWRLDLGGASGTFVQPVPMLVMAAAALWGAWYLGRTVGGRELYALGGNEEAARVNGLSVARIKIRVYALSGFLAGTAGLLSAAYYASANTATGEGYELPVIAAAAVGGASLAGGRGTALGAILGTLVIKLIENGIDIVRRVDLGVVTITLSKEYEKIVIGCAILAAVGADRFARRRE